MRCEVCKFGKIVHILKESSSKPSNILKISYFSYILFYFYQKLSWISVQYCVTSKFLKGVGYICKIQVFA